MKRLVLQSLIAVSLAACGGPDGLAMVGNEVEDDSLEVVEGELTSSSRAEAWFPLGEGNRWEFTSSDGTRTVSLDYYEEGMGLLTGLFAEPTWVGIPTSTSTSLMLWTGEAWAPFVRFGYSRTSWKTGTTACQSLVGQRKATGTMVRTGAGEFTDTRTISFSQVTAPNVRCAAPAFREIAFVPSVGPVAFTTGGGERFVLARASVNGLVVPTPRVTSRVLLDRAAYTSSPNTIRCITTPCPSNEETAVATVTFDVANTSSSTLRWDFASGCQFDVELVSSTGRVVRRLSEGRVCTQALTSLTLQPGQSRAWSAELELEDRDGLQLDGTYTVRARLTPSTSAATAPSATKSLRVTVLAP